VPHAADPARPGVVRLVTGNAASGRGHLGLPDVVPWAQAAADLAPDVLAVQELDHLLPRSARADQTAQIAAAAGLDHHRFAAAVHGTPGHRDTFRPVDPGGPAVPDEPSYGVALLSRHPVRSWWEHHMGPSRMHLPVPTGARGGPRVLWVPDEPRVALAARVAHPAGDLTAVCTHLSFNPVRAAAQLREVVAWAGRLPRPVVLLGDLNLPGRVPARVTGWRAAVTAPTYPAARPTAQLDHVLLDAAAGTWTVTDARATVLAGSDHLALAVAVHT